MGRAWARRCAALVLAACAMHVPAVAAQALADEFIETWSMRDGLPHTTVHGIGQTADGYLWLATWEGIARYNGHDFRLFRRGDVPGLRDDGVRAMHVGPRGALWVGSTRGGIVQWREGRWVPHAGVEGLVTDLLERRDGQLWVATARSGVVHFDRAGRRNAITVEQGLPSNTVNALVQDARGRVWAATSHGLARVDGAHAVPGTGLPEGPVFSLATDARGRVLAGTETGAFVGDGVRFSALHPELAAHTATRLWLDADGAVWVGTNNRGLARVRGGRIEWLDSRGGLPNDRVLALRRDAEGSLWVGTNGGLVRLRRVPIKTYTQRDGLADDFVRTTLATRDGAVWIGSGRGLNRFDARTGALQPIDLRSVSPDLSVLSLAEDAAGDVLVGTFHHGLVRLRDGRIVESISMREGLPSNEVRAVAAAADGTVWIGTKQGLVARRAQGARVYGVPEGLPADYVQALHVDATGAVWVGTGLGAARVVDGTVRAVDLARSDAHYVYGFHPAGGGGMWLATDRGLVHVDARGRATREVGRAAGLPFEKIFALARDARGRMWLTGNEGIAGVAAAQLDALLAGRRDTLDVTLYGRADGMVSPQANGGSGPAATLDAKGRLWVATAIGAARLDPSAVLHRPASLPPVMVERFDVDGRAVDARSVPPLAPGDHRFVVRFVAPTLLDAQRVRYRYRMDGMDAGWVELGNAREVQFTHLDPGRFRLHLQAALPGATASTTTVDFRIRAHWWQRPIVWVGLATLALLALYAAFALRTRQLRRSQARLRALVDEQTAALKIQTQVAESLARTDSLTRLANRRALDQALEHELAELAEGHPLCLVLLDVDGFKPINDLFGHAAGDTALQAVANALVEQARAQDIASRWGGDEFALLLVDCTLEQGLAAAERIRQAVERIDCSHFAPGLAISASIGVACTWRRPGRTGLRTLVPRADEALYRAKREGRNRVRVALEPDAVR